MAYTCIFALNLLGNEHNVPACWKMNESSAQRHCRTLDLILNWKPDLNVVKTQSSIASRKYNNPESGPIYLDSTLPWCGFVIDTLKRLEQPGGWDDAIMVKFILPDRSGFCVLSDFLQRRLDGFDAVLAAQSFLKPRQDINGLDLSDGDGLHASLLSRILSYAVGGMVVKDIDALDGTEAELDSRLSFPWISPSCPPFKRLAYVRGRYNMDHSRRIWDAAYVLGIAIVIVDKEGHWLQHPQWDNIREGFIPANLDPDEGFVDRLLIAIRSYGKPIHGITTVSNKRMVGVAQACEKLGLPTSPLESFTTAADKFKSRQMEPDSEVTAFRVPDIDHLKGRLSSNEYPPIQYPVVVKPCIGWASECISKVHAEKELVQAVEKASERHRRTPIQRGDVMIESYVDGPEIDANIVLLNGDIIFFEVADDFPSMADQKHNKWNDSFQETSMVLPSQLPQIEIDVIRSSLHQTLLRQGFKHGVFNCEGRVRYSHMRYAVCNGVEDLIEDQQNRVESKTPSFYLHEINARPPGYYGNVASNLTYGVDYYALDMLYAIGDMERFRSLAHPFKRGPQWWLVIAIMPEDREGIMKTDEACKGFLQKFEELNASVADCMTWKKGGSKLQGPNAVQLSFLAYFSIISRKSRKEALQLASRVRRDFDYELA
ncbi:glutathione synthetase ATP-binding domain-like protein [Whalleya microplaca]|nr:glutathione synthetase ATP-binding domain-like protein [Whalleya microplaca]